jgi:transposase
LSSAQLLTVREIMRAHPDATLVEMADRVAEATGVRHSPSHLSRILRRLEQPPNRRP